MKMKCFLGSLIIKVSKFELMMRKHIFIQFYKNQYVMPSSLYLLIRSISLCYFSLISLNFLALSYHCCVLFVLHFVSILFYYYWLLSRAILQDFLISDDGFCMMWQKLKHSGSSIFFAQNEFLLIIKFYFQAHLILQHFYY